MEARIIPIIIVWISTIGLSNCNLPPEFVSDLTPPIVKEDTKVGTTVLKLIAKDPENGRLTYGLESTDSLKIDAVSGVISLVKPLDREKVDTIRMVVTVEDEVDGAENNVMKVPLDLIVIDVNDNAPSFSQNIYRLDVSENSEIGSKIPIQIWVSDADQIGDILKVDCTHEEKDDTACDYFEVTASEESPKSFKGTLTVKKELSYDKNEVHEATLVASDGEHITKSRIILSIKDEQNTPPIFQGSTTAVVSEDAPIGTLIMVISASDGDKGVPRKIMYELVEDSYGIFNLDSETGELRTARPMDREAHKNPSAPLKLTVRAFEVERGGRVRGSDAQSSRSLSITVTDVNDEAPTFNHKEYRVTIPENSPIGTPVSDLNMIVNDADSGKNSVFSIRLKDSSRRFIIEPNAAIGSSSLSLRTMNKTFDYENPNDRNFIMLAIAEESLTKEKLSSTATIHVTIKDENDNSPTFRQEAYTSTVSETAGEGTIVTTIIATDRDSGIFGSKGIRYSIFGNGAEKFLVDAKTGTISVGACDSPGEQNCLDFETKQTYFLSLQATDDEGTGISTTVPIRISLVDENDNPPSFKRPAYRSTILESASDFDPPLFVKAIDPDVSSSMTYSIIGGNNENVFQIDSHTGRIRIRDDPQVSLSSIKNNSVTLSVQATDGELTATSQVRITIRDVNNNKPIFEQPYYSVAVQENTLVGSTVETVKANDADRGMNAEIQYQIQKGSYGDFDIDKQKGTLTVSKPLDYNKRNNYFLEIVATDKGIPSLSSSCTVNISVIDRNNKAPYFTPNTQRVQVSENAPSGTLIYRLHAQDADSKSKESLVFSLVGVSLATKKDGNPLQEQEKHLLRDTFAVNPIGEVRLSRNLNRNISNEISLEVQVQDTSASAATQTGKGTLIITITEMNKHPPMFSPPWTADQPYITVSMSEEAPLNSVVTTVSAFDLDSNIEGYEFVEPSSNTLTIDEITGVVTVQRRLDYEKLEKVNATIVVRDTGIPQLSTTALLIVKLNNINDEQPVFEKEIYEASVEEHSEPGTRVLSVKATDGDKGALGTITYYLMGNHMQYFTIDSDGNIYIAQGVSIDRDEFTEFNLRVVAEDSGPETTRRRTSVPIQIDVIDINDHRPVFIHKEYAAVINQNLPGSAPIPVLQVAASDKDKSLLTYSIISSTEDAQSNFFLNSSTGIFYALPPIKITEETVFNFMIDVSDGNNEGVKPDESKVEITIVPQNENKPTFTNPPYPDFVYKIFENAKEMTVTEIRASDNDIGENGVISYYLRVGDQNVHETETFVLDESTGELSTKHSLDRENTDHYQLIVVARDHGTPTAYETLVVINIQVQDVDDNQPKFSSSDGYQTYKYKLEENAPKDTFVGNVEAYDSDQGENARIFYYIADGNTNSKIYIDKSNGNLFTADEIDREEINYFNLLILASNNPNAESSLYRKVKNESFAYTRIDIQDVNDTPPRFSNNIFYAGVPPVAEIGRLVTEVKALDEDEGINGTVNYSIKNSIVYLPGQEKPLGSIVPSPFNITQKGTVVAASAMSPYKRHRFLLEVSAREAAAPYRTASCQVNIWVWEREELIKVVLEERPEEVASRRAQISQALSSALNGTTVIDEIRYFTHPNNTVDRNWSEVLIHVVNKTSGVVAPDEVLFKADRAYAALSKQQESSKIRKIYPVIEDIRELQLDARIGGLIALLAALGLGLLTFIVVYCCLRVWVLTPARSKEKLIHRTQDDDLGLNTTENPLWLDQKLKSYEEQELSMHVSSDIDAANLPQAQNGLFSDDAQSNAYATIQKSLSGTVRSQHLKNLHKQRGNMVLSLGHEIGESNDYATLDHLRGMQIENNEPRDGPSSNMFNRPLPAEPPTLSTKQSGEPCLVAELL